MHALHHVKKVPAHVSRPGTADKAGRRGSNSGGGGSNSSGSANSPQGILVAGAAVNAKATGGARDAAGGSGSSNASLLRRSGSTLGSNNSSSGKLNGCPPDGPKRTGSSKKILAAAAGAASGQRAGFPSSSRGNRGAAAGAAVAAQCAAGGNGKGHNARPVVARGSGAVEVVDAGETNDGAGDRLTEEEKELLECINGAGGSEHGDGQEDACSSSAAVLSAERQYAGEFGNPPDGVAAVAAAAAVGDPTAAGGGRARSRPVSPAGRRYDLQESQREVYEEQAEEEEAGEGEDEQEGIAVGGDFGTAELGSSSRPCGTSSWVGSVPISRGGGVQQALGLAIAPGLEGQLRVYAVSSNPASPATATSQQALLIPDGYEDGEQQLQQQQQGIPSYRPVSGHSSLSGAASPAAGAVAAGISMNSSSNLQQGRLVMRPATGQMRMSPGEIGTSTGGLLNSASSTRVGKLAGGGDVPQLLRPASAVPRPSW